MKRTRIMAMLLVVGILFCANALAETVTPRKMSGTFTIRDGIKFGMTKQQVIEFEKNEGMRQGSDWDRFNIRYAEDNNHMVFYGTYLPVYMRSNLNDTRAKDYRNASLYTEFKNNKLCEIDYVWNGFDTSDANAVQNEILPSLRSKYGSPMSIPENKLLFTNYGPYLFYGEYNYTYTNTIYGDPYFWLLKYDDGYCLVTFYTLKQQVTTSYVGGKSWGYTQMHLIYSYISESEYDEYVNAINKNNQTINDEKKNGL